MKQAHYHQILAIIPARGGSKGIIRKNIRPVLRKPLIGHTILAAKQSQCIDRIIVSTDDEEIAAISKDFGAEVISRPHEISDDLSSSESAIRHALDTLEKNEQYIPDFVVFLQCTSPIRKDDDIDNAIRQLITDDADSLLSVSPSHRFIWRKEKDGFAPLNYDYRNRSRRQDLPPEYVENGSMYIFKPWVLEELYNRLGGKISLYEMDYWSSFEIDTIEDLELCEWIMSRKKTTKYIEKIPEKIDLIAFDFDGVFTDNKVLLLDNGTEGVVCDRGDGMGIEMLRKAGIDMMVLSKEKNPVVSARCRKLNLECIQGIDTKENMLKRLLVERHLKTENIIFVGNDINDIECMNIAACAVAPADAHPGVMKKADIILQSEGGKGAIRELSELIIGIIRNNEDTI